MKRLAFAWATAAAITLGGIGSASASDIVEDILRSNFDLMEEDGGMWHIVRTPRDDGTERYAKQLRIGDTHIDWEVSSITRHNGDGWLNGLAHAELTRMGTAYSYAYTPDMSGRISSVSMLISPNRESSRTPHSKQCKKGESGCYTLRDKDAIIFMTYFARGLDGSLVSGVSQVLWATDHGPIVKTSPISFQQVNDGTTRMTFEEYAEPWAYPLAGYEFEKRADGKRLLRVCYSFVNDVCNTTRD